MALICKMQDLNFKPIFGMGVFDLCLVWEWVWRVTCVCVREHMRHSNAYMFFTVLLESRQLENVENI